MTTDMQIGIAKQTILHELRQLQAAYPNDPGLARLAHDTRAYYDMTTELSQATAAIREDENLSDAGKQTKIAETTAAWQVKINALQDTIEATTGQLLAEQGTPPTLAAPIADEVLLEARLGNARADARMYLDATDAHQLPRRMRELVEHGADPSLTYLLLATNWGEHYLRSRAPTAKRAAEPGQAIFSPLLEWAHTRLELTRTRLTPEQTKAWDHHAALTRTLPRIPGTLRMTTQHHERARHTIALRKTEGTGS